MTDQIIWLTCQDSDCGMRNPATINGEECESTCGDEDCSMRMQHDSLTTAA